LDQDSGALDPLSYFVDGLRNVLFSHSTVAAGQLAGSNVQEVASSAGLIRFSLPADLAIVMGFAVLLSAIGAYRFSSMKE
jgi:hypothetical protein